MGHKCWFSEDDEQSIGLVKIITKTQSTPFWTRLSVLLTSDVSYFDDCWNVMGKAKPSEPHRTAVDPELFLVDR